VIVKKGMLLAVTVVTVVTTMLAMPALPQGQGRPPEAQRRRNQIRIMEGVLVQAVRLAAEEVSAEMEKFEPMGVTALMGVPRARGFILDGYGVFFDVEIPALNQSVVWSVLVTQRERQVGNALDSLRNALKSMPDGPPVQQAQQALQLVEKSVGPTQTAKGGLPAQPAPGQVSAASVPVPPDPAARYTDVVKSALVEAMLDHSLQIGLGPDEWLTVAARDSQGPLDSSAVYDAQTIILRVKGSDLAAYLAADPARRDEIRQKVKVDARVF